ncbi:MAG: ATP-binding protein [Candidatus Micrarchaeia archaeon]
MVEIFKAKKELLEKLSWEENPFVKDLHVKNKEEFLKYYCPFESEKILKRLAFDMKACLLLGPKGVGKTSSMYYLYYMLPQDEFDCVMFKEPPSSLKEITDEAGLDQENIIEAILGLFGGKKLPISRKALADELRKKRKKTVFFVDEAHLEANPAMYMEFKYLLDEVSNLRIIFSALGKDNFPDSLLQLIGDGNVFSRHSFNKEEMQRIIKHRIAAVGGIETEPFGEKGLKSVLSEQNLLTPRYVFDELNNYLAAMATEGEKTAKKGLKHEEKAESSEFKEFEALEEEFPDEGSGITSSNAEWWDLLSPSQKAVLSVLVKKNKALSLSEIKKEADLSQNTAFNALYQLRGEDEGELERKPEVPFPVVIAKKRLVGGRKRNIYFINSKIKNLFTLH